MKYARACITHYLAFHIFMHENVHGALYLPLQYIKNDLKTKQNWCINVSNPLFQKAFKYNFVKQFFHVDKNYVIVGSYDKIYKYPIKLSHTPVMYYMKDN